MWQNQLEKYIHSSDIEDNQFEWQRGWILLIEDVVSCSCTHWRRRLQNAHIGRFYQTTNWQRKMKSAAKIYLLIYGSLRDLDRDGITNLCDIIFFKHLILKISCFLSENSEPFACIFCLQLQEMLDLLGCLLCFCLILEW